MSRYLARAFPVDGVRAAIADTDVTMFVAEDSASIPMAYAYLRASHDPPSGVTPGRAFEIGTHAPLGEYISPLAARKNVSGFVVGPGDFYWNLKKN